MHVIATAGHVDHGKSTLIRALTGIEPDRLDEERRRGMTIDLGYAWTTLSDGTPVAFVDVPGHQRFVTNMLAGIGPVPAVLLVVAADEGWSRQTTEHLAALEALGVSRGILAVTRADLGDVDLAVEEARDYLAGTGLEGIEAVGVSAVTGRGLTEVRAAIERLVAALPTPNLDVTRLWVDRVFTIRGAGTVVTGTLGCGRLAVGDELVVAASGETVHIRGIETMKTAHDSVDAVARVALNLRGTTRATLGRGDALVRPGQWTHTDLIDVRLTNVTGRVPAHPIVHVGSAAVSARFRPFDEQSARLHLAQRLPLHIGDRVILRDPGPQHVVAGAVVLDVLPPALARRGSAMVRAREMGAMPEAADLHSELSRRRAVRRSTLSAAGVALPATETSSVVAVGDWLVVEPQWADWTGALQEAVKAWAKAHPLQPAMPAGAVSHALGLPDASFVAPLVAGVADLTVDGDGVHARDSAAVLPAEIRSALDDLAERLTTRPFDVPEAHELASAGLTDRYLAVATKRGDLVRVAHGIYLRPSALARAVELLAQLPQPFTVSEARQALGTTRRVAVPLLELLDRQRATRRVDDQRREIAPAR